jgi:hypothetical protein
VNGDGPPAASAASGRAVRTLDRIVALPPVRWFVTRYVSALAQELTRAMRAEEEPPPAPPALEDEKPRSAVRSGV